jgi:hypothetical protein
MGGIWGFVTKPRPRPADEQSGPAANRGLRWDALREAERAPRSERERLARLAGTHMTLSRRARRRAARDPRAAVLEQLAIITDELELNQIDPRGTMNRPRYNRAMATIAAMEQMAVAPLLEILDGPHGESGSVQQSVIWDVVELLGAIGDIRAVEPLRRLLAGPNPSVPLALARMKDLAGLQVLLDAVRSDPDAHVRARAASGLGSSRLRTEGVVAALVEALGDASGHVRGHAARALGGLEIPSQPTLQALATVEHDDPMEWARNGAEWARIQLNNVHRDLPPVGTRYFGLPRGWALISDRGRADLARIGREMFGPPYPWSELRLVYPDGSDYVMWAVDVLGTDFPLIGTEQWRSFEERFCTELLEASASGGSWARAGALLVASDLHLASRNPLFLEIVDRGLEALHDNRVPYMAVPNFALTRWREIRRDAWLSPLHGFASVHREPISPSIRDTRDAPLA